MQRPFGSIQNVPFKIFLPATGTQQGFVMIDQLINTVDTCGGRGHSRVMFAVLSDSELGTGCLFARGCPPGPATEHCASCFQLFRIQRAKVQSEKNLTSFCRIRSFPYNFVFSKMHVA